MDKAVEEQRLLNIEAASTPIVSTDPSIECTTPRLTRPWKILSDFESHGEPLRSLRHRCSSFCRSHRKKSVSKDVILYRTPSWTVPWRAGTVAATNRLIRITASEVVTRRKT